METRRKMAKAARRTAKRRAMARKRKKMRIKTGSQLQAKAGKAARSKLIKKLFGKTPYSQMGHHSEQTMSLPLNLLLSTMRPTERHIGHNTEVCCKLLAEISRRACPVSLLAPDLIRTSCTRRRRHAVQDTKCPQFSPTKIASLSMQMTHSPC